MKILITGATSFLGSYLMDLLIQQGLQIRAAHPVEDSLQNSESDFLIEGLDLEDCPLDLNDRRAVFQAVEGCSMIFHAQCLVSFLNKDKSRLYQINHLGTKLLLEAAFAHGVEKFIYTSGMETLKAPPGKEIATELDGVTLEELQTPFEKSRFLAEREIHHYQAKGLATIMVHPTVCVGKKEHGSTLFGKYLNRFLKRQTHFYLDTGLNLVAVEDVAKGHILAAKRGQPGSRYILGNQNFYLLEILRKLEAMTDIQAPKTALPFGVAKWGNRLVRNVFQRRAGIPTPLIKRLESPLFFDCTKARQELGMPQRDVFKALQAQLS